MLPRVGQNGTKTKVEVARDGSEAAAGMTLANGPRIFSILLGEKKAP